MNPNTEKTNTQFVVMKQRGLLPLLTETYKIAGILFILGVNHYRLDDSFFGALVLTILFLITFFSLKPSSYKHVKTLHNEKQLKEFMDSQLNKQKNE